MSLENANHVALVGLMGVGKTAVGTLLAKKLDCVHTDLDLAVMNSVGRSVGVIFAESGETGFRDLEEKVLNDNLSKEDPSVISTGGGVVERALNREQLKEKTMVIWLRAELGTLVKRIGQSSSRPLLKDRDPLKALIEINERRSSLYEEVADVIIDTDQISISDVTELLLGLYLKDWIRE